MILQPGETPNNLRFGGKNLVDFGNKVSFKFTPMLDRNQFFKISYDQTEQWIKRPMPYESINYNKMMDQIEV